MDKIEKKDWEFVFNKNDPKYEEKFDSLFQKYYENTIKNKLCTDKEAVLLEEFTQKPYWVLSLPALPNQTKNNAEKRRIEIFLAIMNNVRNNR